MFFLNNYACEEKNYIQTFTATGSCLTSEQSVAERSRGIISMYFTTLVSILNNIDTDTIRDARVACNLKSCTIILKLAKMLQVVLHNFESVHE